MGWLVHFSGMGWWLLKKSLPRCYYIMWTQHSTASSVIYEHNLQIFSFLRWLRLPNIWHRERFKYTGRKKASHKTQKVTDADNGWHWLFSWSKGGTSHIIREEDFVHGVSLSLKGKLLTRQKGFCMFPPLNQTYEQDRCTAGWVLHIFDSTFDPCTVSSSLSWSEVNIRIKA